MQHSKEKFVTGLAILNPIRVFSILLIILGVERISGETINNSFPIQSEQAPQFWTDVCFYKGSSGYTQLELYYSVALKDLQCVSDSSGRQATFTLSVIVKDSDNKVVFNKSQRKILRSKAKRLKTP